MNSEFRFVRRNSEGFRTLPGARVWFRPLAEDDPVRPGDVLIYLAKTGLVVHRAVALLAGGNLRTKGDGRATLDAQPVSRDAIIGRVLAVSRGGATYSLEGRGAIAYARSLAFVSHLVGVSARLVRAVERRLQRILHLRTDRAVLAAVVAVPAKIALHVADGLLFSMLHAPQRPPGESVVLASGDEADPSVGGGDGVE